MSDEDTDTLQGLRRRAPSASNPPASPGASQPPLGTASRADLEQNSGFMDAADAAAHESQSVRDFADANPGVFAGAEHDDELRTQPAEAAAASAPEAAATLAATTAAAAIDSHRRATTGPQSSNGSAHRQPNRRTSARRSDSAAPPTTAPSRTAVPSTARHGTPPRQSLGPTGDH